MKLVLNKNYMGIVVGFLSRYRVFIVAFVFVGVAFHATQGLSHIANPPKASKLYEEKLAELRQNDVVLDDSTIQAINERTVRGTDVSPTNEGNPNPFN